MRTVPGWIHPSSGFAAELFHGFPTKYCFLYRAFSRFCKQRCDMMEKDMEIHGWRPAPISHFRRVLAQGVVNADIQNAHYAGAGTEEDPYAVSWLDHDPVNPMEYPAVVKWGITMLVAFATLAVAFASSAFSGGIAEIIREFHQPQIIGILGVSLFVLGFALGPLLWAPMSELFGRQYLFFGTYLSLTALNAGAAGSMDMATLIVLRFLAGAFGSSPLTNAGGVIADMFPAKQRGVATSMYAAAPFLGPALGPIVGGFVGQTIGWRWIEGVMAIFTGTLLIICGLLVPETYAPVLLRQRAATLSQRTGKVYKSKTDIQRAKVTLGQAFKTALCRPWILLFREPIVLLLSFYMAIIYGTLYMLFAAFPIVYQRGRGWSPGVGGLAFLGITVGMMLAVAYSIWDNRRYVRAIEASPSGFASPEARLPPAMLASICIPIALFCFAWTNSPSIHWSVSIIATAPFGFGMVLVFLAVTNYLIDAYVIYAASVLAANAVLRSLFGVAFPLFTSQMYAALGLHWASAVPAFLALACVPFPFVLHRYGPAVRRRCRFAAEAEAFLHRLRAADAAPPSDDDDDSAAAANAASPEAEAEGEAPDLGGGPRARQPAYAAARTPGEGGKTAAAPLRGTGSSGSLQAARSWTYEASPYDIDRINTNESFARTASNSRAGSCHRK